MVTCGWLKITLASLKNGFNSKDDESFLRLLRRLQCNLSLSYEPFLGPLDLRMQNTDVFQTLNLNCLLKIIVGDFLVFFIDFLDRSQSVFNASWKIMALLVTWWWPWIHWSIKQLHILLRSLFERSGQWSAIIRYSSGECIPCKPWAKVSKTILRG